MAKFRKWRRENNIGKSLSGQRLPKINRNRYASTKKLDPVMKIEDAKKSQPVAPATETPNPPADGEAKPEEDF